MSESSQINIYGAVTQRPGDSCDFNIKQNIRQSIDRILFRLTPKNTIDYRNYLNSGVYNLGDHAIALAAAQQVNSVAKHIDVNLVDWGALESATRSTPTLIAGSGYFFIEPSKSPAARIELDSQYLLKNSIAHAFHGVGVNYVSSGRRLTLGDIPEEGQKLLSRSLAKARAISVRDATSKSILQPLTDTNVIITGDPALFIKSDTANHRLNPAIGTSLTIGINIPFHGPAASARVSKDLKSYIQFFKALQKKTNCQFIQTIHFHSEIVIGKILQDHGIPLIQAIGGVQTLLSAYQQMDFHIGGMLHSCILSASTGTPCIGLAYDIKHQGFFDLLGQPDLCVPAEPFDPERLSATCDHVLTHADTIRKQINARRDELELTSNQFLAQTLQALLS
ncbi:polysaccharide pyruvyl transferase family protein [Hydrogenophaga sp.]|uniref:polysaccharide pyruvyl transferase family protein n=1 Tax=Hydrogenophaga sp. TaxID=1904254 RepID=UPI00273100C1|nr:polysaccharide pyruvyl transferase family protein [Hydrogenophaga sp.]MDP2073784.1 polysaccharide pyruvyl transferase family protein [Hydrogenophaga sp.]MDP3106908.1 polysaccharide pyruvyl transferase family protein [Hydrogenophaga sp.]